MTFAICNRRRNLVFCWLLALLLMVSGGNSLRAQERTESSSGTTTWLILQALPSFSWTTFPSQTNFAFEWEATPVLYSFGMTKLVSPWHFFFVNQPARFTGSVEFVLSGQLYVSKVGDSHTAISGQLLAHLPLVEKGEYLGLNLGAARYRFGNFSSSFGVLGFSTLYGFFHYNIKYSPDDKIWMNSIELRFF